MASKRKLEKARDAMRALAAGSAPKGLTPPQAKAYVAEMKKVRASADSTHALIQKVDKSLREPKPDYDKLADMSDAFARDLRQAMEKRAK